MDPLTPQVTPQVAPQAYMHDLEPAQRLVIALSRELGSSQIQDLLELKDRKYFRTAYLNPASEKGYIEPTIPDKPTSPNQKYRLTKKGITLKKELLDERK